VHELGCDVLAALTALPPWIIAHERRSLGAFAAAN
jgi:hypothetical protein